MQMRQRMIASLARLASDRTYPQMWPTGKAGRSLSLQAQSYEAGSCSAIA